MEDEKTGIKEKIKVVAINASQSVQHFVYGNPATAAAFVLAAITGIVLLIKKKKKQ